MHRRNLLKSIALCPLALQSTSVLADGLSTRAGDAAHNAVTQGHPPAIGVLTIDNGRAGHPWVTGHPAAGANRSVRAGDVWHIGSNAKSMTAVLIARMVEAERLGWDVPLSGMLPDMPQMRPEYRAATLQDLLSHRAGLSRNSEAGVARIVEGDGRPLMQQREDYVRAALTEPPVGPVGAGPGEYSNTGFVIAGLIAERKAGIPFESLMQTEVFAPLGMQHVGFGGTAPGNTAGHKNGRPVYGDEGDNPAILRPAGGLYLPLADWGRYLEDQLAGEAGKGRLLSQESYRLLHTAQGDSQNGLGWGLEPGPHGERMWSHNGSNGRWFAMVVVLPDERRGVAVVSNEAGDEVEKVINRVAVHALGWGSQAPA